MLKPLNIRTSKCFIPLRHEGERGIPARHLPLWQEAAPVSSHHNTPLRKEGALAGETENRAFENFGHNDVHYISGIQKRSNGAEFDGTQNNLSHGNTIKYGYESTYKYGYAIPTSRYFLDLPNSWYFLV